MAKIDPQRRRRQIRECFDALQKAKALGRVMLRGEFVPDHELLKHRKFSSPEEKDRLWDAAVDAAIYRRDISGLIETLRQFEESIPNEVRFLLVQILTNRASEDLGILVEFTPARKTNFNPEYKAKVDHARKLAQAVFDVWWDEGGKINRGTFEQIAARNDSDKTAVKRAWEEYGQELKRRKALTLERQKLNS